MDSIFAVIDAQFFKLNNKNIIREFAIVGENVSMCYEFDSDICRKNMSYKCRRTNKYIQKYLTGLTFRPRAASCGVVLLKQDEFVLLLEAFQKQLATKEKNCFGVKNHFLCEILSANGIPCIDLNLTECPNTCSLFKEQWLCAFHTEYLENRRNFRCAFRKVLGLYKWINLERVQALF